MDVRTGHARLLVAACLFAAALPFAERARAAAQCGDQPDVLILLDRSGSMSQDNKWNDAKTAINNLLRA
jgi:Mg-chelatase subunit ChlD